MKTSRLFFAGFSILLAVFIAQGCHERSGSAGHGPRNTNIVILTPANFQKEVLGASQPVLVDFWASWCGPCRALAPTLDEIATEFSGRAKLGAVNVDEAPALAEQYGVNALPTVALFKDGKLVEQSLGLKPKAEYQRMLNSALGGKENKAAAR